MLDPLQSEREILFPSPSHSNFEKSYNFFLSIGFLTNKIRELHWIRRFIVNTYCLIYSINIVKFLKSNTVIKLPLSLLQMDPLSITFIGPRWTVQKSY